MASSERAGRGAVEGFVSRLVGDPANPPEVAVLTGYPGASSLEGHIRVYLRGVSANTWTSPRTPSFTGWTFPRRRTLWVRSISGSSAMPN